MKRLLLLLGLVTTLQAAAPILPGILSQSAPFTPASISGLQLWLDASDSSTITQSGGNVSQWNDKSGNANNATQATGSAQPVYGATSFNTSHPGLTFNGTSDWMSVPNITLGDYDAFVVVTNNGVSANILWLLNNLGTNTQLLTLRGDMNAISFVLAGTEYSSSAFITTTTNPGIMELARSGGTASPYYNGTGSSTFTVPNTSVTLQAICNIINVAYANCTIAEIVLYNNQISSGSRTALYNYLKTKWGTP